MGCNSWHGRSTGMITTMLVAPMIGRKECAHNLWSQSQKRHDGYEFSIQICSSNRDGLSTLHLPEHYCQLYLGCDLAKQQFIMIAISELVLSFTLLSFNTDCT